LYLNLYKTKMFFIWKISMMIMLYFDKEQRKEYCSVLV